MSLSDTLDPLDRAIMRATQAGLPLVSRPFAEVARQVGCSEDEVLTRFQRWQQNGVLRRIAAVPNHYALGYVHNGMTVWNVADERVAAGAEQAVAFYDFGGPEAAGRLAILENYVGETIPGAHQWH